MCVREREREREGMLLKGHFRKSFQRVRERLPGFDALFLRSDNTRIHRWHTITCQVHSPLASDTTRVSATRHSAWLRQHGRRGGRCHGSGRIIILVKGPDSTATAC